MTKYTQRKQTVKKQLNADSISSVKGKRNNIAGRDLYITEYHSLWEHVQNKLNAIDSRVNELIPENIESPTKNNELESFSSERMLSSLSALGIPIEAGIKVVENVEKYLPKVIEDVDQVKTSHIRKAVSLAIYCLDTKEFSSSEVQNWGTRYARRYGNPDAPIKIVESDGNEQILDYHYIKTIVIPHLVGRIVKSKFEDIKELLGANKVAQMSKEILENVKLLNLYSIQYRTLINIATDLALQPPHPWFVEQAFMSKTVEYDLERAVDHLHRIMESSESQEISHTLHSCSECIHHSCSAILGFYGSLIGPTSSNAMHDLIRVLELCAEGGNIVLWEHSKIHQIEGDLKAVDESRSDLLLLLNKTKIYLNQTSKDAVENLIRYAAMTHSIANKLIGNRAPLSDETACQDRFKTLRTQTELASLTADILKRIDSCRLQIINGREDFYWLKHNIGTVAFRDIKARIFIAPVYKEVEMESDNLKEYCAIVNGLLQGNSTHSNTVIFIFHPEYSSEHRSIIDMCLSRDYYAILLDSKDIVTLCDAQNRVERFEDLIMN